MCNIHTGRQLKDFKAMTNKANSGRKTKETSRGDDKAYFRNKICAIYGLLSKNDICLLVTFLEKKLKTQDAQCS